MSGEVCYTGTTIVPAHLHYSLPESRFHAHLRDFLDLRLREPQADGRGRHEERILAQQRVAERKNVVRLHPSAQYQSLRSKLRHIKYHGTHAYRDGVVVAEIIAEVVRIEGRDGLAKQVGGEADLDAHLVRVHDLLRRGVKEGRVPEPVGFVGQQAERFWRRTVWGLACRNIRGESSDPHQARRVGRRTSAMWRVTPSPAALAARKCSANSSMLPACNGK